MSRAPAVIAHGAPPPERGRYVIAVPGQLAPIQRFDLPTGLRGAARIAVARQQLTDRLGAGAAGVQLVPLGGAEWDRAAVCDQRHLALWCDTAAARNARCDGVVPDMLTLPGAEATLVLTPRADALLARSGLEEGFASPLPLAVPLLDRLIAETGPAQVHITGDLPADVRACLVRHVLEEVPAPAAPSRPVVDLRTALKASDATGLQVWGTAAAVALLAFGLWATSLWVETRALQRDAANIRSATTALLREGLIPEGPIIDVRQQVSQAIARQETAARPQTGSPVDLLSRATVALFGVGLDLGQITLDSASGSLVVDVTATSFAEVDALVASLSDSGLLAGASDMRNATGGGVSARLQLQFAEAAE